MILPTFIAIIAIAALIILWIRSIRCKLAVLDENTNNAMHQIGVQLSSRFNLLIVLVDLIANYVEEDIKNLRNNLELAFCPITGKSSPEEVLQQEKIISESLGKIAQLSEQYPQLKENPNYTSAMDAVETFAIMLRTSRLIYNDSVSKLNREIKSFPISIIARMLGFQKRKYLME